MFGRKCNPLKIYNFMFPLKFFKKTKKIYLRHNAVKFKQ